MIAANELRIGNWVNINVECKDGTFDGNYQIEEIREDVILFNKGIHAAYRMLYPIPLTEERLLRCGFEKAGIYYCMGGNEDGGIVLKLNDSMYFPIITSFGIGIKYLHQLQNLYFALKGKELEVKL